MLADAGNRSKFRRMLRELADDKTDLLLEWLAGASPGEFQAELDLVLASHSIRYWSPSQLERFFAAWVRAGDPERLIATLTSNEHWREAGWRELAAAHALRKDYRAACETVRTFQPPPEVPVLPERGRDEAESAFYRNPRDFIAGMQAYYAQSGADSTDAALTTLDKLAALPDAPSYLSWLRAGMLEKQEHWPEAWAALSQFIR
jgi:hypothetical protein